MFINGLTEQYVNGVWQKVTELKLQCVFSEQWASVFRITGLTLHRQTTDRGRQLIQQLINVGVTAVVGLIVVCYCQFPILRSSCTHVVGGRGETTHFNHRSYIK